MVLLSSSPVIENCQYRGRESVSDSIIDVAWTVHAHWMHYIDDLLPYEQNYAATGHVVKFSLLQLHRFISCILLNSIMTLTEW